MIAMINNKVHSDEYDYLEKNDFIDFQIENCIQFFNDWPHSPKFINEKLFIEVKKAINKR